MATFNSTTAPAGFSVGYNLATGEAARIVFGGTAGTDVFTNASGGLDWSVPGNWSMGALPSASDTALISTGSGISYAVTHSTGTDNIAVLTINSGNSLDVSGGSLAVSGVTTVGGGLTVSGTGAATLIGSLNAGLTGAIAVSGGSLNLGAASTVNALNLTGGTVQGAGSLQVTTQFSQTGGSIAMSGPVTIQQSVGDLSVGSISGAAITLLASNGSIGQSAALVTPGQLDTTSSNGTVLNIPVIRWAVLLHPIRGQLAISNCPILGL